MRVGPPRPVSGLPNLRAKRDGPKRFTSLKFQPNPNFFGERVGPARWTWLGLTPLNTKGPSFNDQLVHISRLVIMVQASSKPMLKTSFYIDLRHNLCSQVVED